MIGYVAHIVREYGNGDEWQVWIGMAANINIANDLVKGLIADLNSTAESKERWIAQTIQELDLPTVLSGGQAMVATFYYHNAVELLTNKEDNDLWKSSDDDGDLWYLDDTCLGS